MKTVVTVAMNLSMKAIPLEVPIGGANPSCRKQKIVTHFLVSPDNY